MTQCSSVAEVKPAPGPLARIQALVNTIELPAGCDRLADPAEAAPFLVDHGLLSVGAMPTAAELDRLRDVREALRAVLIHHAGGPPPVPEVLQILSGIAAAGTARVQVAADGQVDLGAAGDGVGDRLIELLLVMRDAQRDGTWVRLKACANAECTWAFYDRSRNRGGTWCDMSDCGNRLKNREFRARRRAARRSSG